MNFVCLIIGIICGAAFIGGMTAGDLSAARSVNRNLESCQEALRVSDAKLEAYRSKVDR